MKKIIVKDPTKDSGINFICSDGKVFKDDEIAANTHEKYLFKLRTYNNLSWFKKLITKKPLI